MKHYTALLVGLTLQLFHAHADTTQLNDIKIIGGHNCQPTGVSLGKCQFDTQNIIKPLEEENRFLETDFSITYSFVCQGHTTYFEFASGQNSTPMPTSSPLTSQIVQFTGSSELKLRVNSPAQFTKYARFANTCNLEQLFVVRAPSLNVVVLWETEARYQKKILRYSSDAFRLVTNLEAIQVFNAARLQTMKRRLEDVVEDLEDLLDDLDPGDIDRIEMVEDSIDSAKKVILKLDRAITDQTLPDFGQDGGYPGLKALFRQRLESELDISRGMMQRFYRYGYGNQAEEVYESLVKYDPNGVNPCGLQNNDFSGGGNGGCFDIPAQIAWSRPSRDRLTAEEAKTFCLKLTDGGNQDWQLPDRDQAQRLKLGKYIFQEPLEGHVWIKNTSPSGALQHVEVRDGQVILPTGEPTVTHAGTVCVR